MGSSAENFKDFQDTCLRWKEQWRRNGVRPDTREKYCTQRKKVCGDTWKYRPCNRKNCPWTSMWLRDELANPLNFSNSSIYPEGR